MCPGKPSAPVAMEVYLNAFVATEMYTSVRLALMQAASLQWAVAGFPASHARNCIYAKLLKSPMWGCDR